MYKRLSEVQKEKGLSKQVLMRIAHSKDTPAIKTSEKGRWMFDMDRLEKWLARHSVVVILMLLLIGPVKAEAGTLKPSYAIGGGSYLLEKYFETNDELYSEEDLRLLSAAMELENGCNSDECLYLTGSVILNRRDYCKWCPNTIRGVLYQKGQYASHTVNNLETVVVSDRVRNIALNLLLCGTRTPKNLVYQAMRPQGKHYKKVDTEYFGLEE